MAAERDYPSARLCLRADSAMSVAGVSSLEEITLNHLATEAASWGYPRDRAHELAGRLIERVAAAAEAPSFHKPVRELVQFLAGG